MSNRRRGDSPSAARARRGLSIIFVVIALVVLIGFVSLAVDVGRVRLAKAELQTAADAAALAGASGLELAPEDIGEAEFRAVSAGAENVGIDVQNSNGARYDRSIEIVPGEDVQYGIWRRDSRIFEVLEDYGNDIDERRRANAVRAFGRRGGTFTQEDMDGNTLTFERNNGLKLIFAPVLPDGPLTGHIETRAIAIIEGGRQGMGFIGLDWVRFVGTTLVDSYNAAVESYPGADGIPNQDASISSNGNITLVGTTDIHGDVHPGIEADILPNPLTGDVEVTGYMHPLDKVLVEGVDYTVPTFSPTTLEPDTPYHGSPTSLSGDLLFKNWTTGGNDDVTINNLTGPVNIWVDGDFKHGGNAIIRIPGAVHAVNFYVDGDISITGGNIIQLDSAPPAILTFNVTKANTDVVVQGVPALAAHINAPLSDLSFNGTGKLAFYGWAIGKTLTVTGNMELHYDQSRDVHHPWTTRLVK